MKKLLALRKLDFFNFGLVPELPILKKQLINALSILRLAERSKLEDDIRILFEHYLLMWDVRKYARPFFQSGAIFPRIEQIFRNKTQVVTFSTDSEIYSVAAELITEYETYIYHWTETRRFMKKQRDIASSHRLQFFDLVVAKDGTKCKVCGRKDDLKLDHIMAVSHGGLSVIENFQLLCFTCISKKARHERAVIYGGLTETKC